MTQIIAFSGLRSAGKTTSRNYVMGTRMVEMGVISRFSISDKGELVVPTVVNDELHDSPMLVDAPLFRSHPWVNQCIYPICKNFSFAYELRVFCCDYLGLSNEMLFGSYENKLKDTHIKWASVPKVPGLTKGKTEYMTVRDVLEYFGGLMRQFNPNVWVDKVISQIQENTSCLVIIDDVRYPNEVKAIQAVGGVVIRLTRSVSEEIDSDKPLAKENFDWAGFDVVLDNQNLGIHGTNLLVHAKLAELGIFQDNISEAELPEPVLPS